VHTLIGPGSKDGMLNTTLDVSEPVKEVTAHVEPAVLAALFNSVTPESVALRPDDDPLLSFHAPDDALYELMSNHACSP